jgi:type IV pilus assembly protein PilE
MRKHQEAFTMLELLTAMTIIAILAAIAIPTYAQYVQQARRSDAGATLLLAAQWMERYRSENNGSYADAELPAQFSQSPGSGTAMYNITLTNLAAGTYTLSAAPTGTMSADVCETLTLDNTGLRTAKGGSTSAADLKLCWKS